MKRLLKRLLEPKSTNWKQTISTLIVVCLCMFVGFISGYYAATGTFPTFAETKSVVPPEVTVTTLADIQTALEQVPKKEYGFGYNCVNLAWDAMRQLNWSGQPAVIIVLMFEETPHHTLLLTATKDEGWTFIEPRVGAVVRPRVGELYNSKTITAMKVLKMVWVPIDEFFENPTLGEIR